MDKIAEFVGTDVLYCHIHNHIMKMTGICELQNPYINRTCAT
jgi:hypothetical protein